MTRIRRAQPPLQTRQRLLADTAWAFHCGDIPFTAPHTIMETYHHAKTGAGPGAAAPRFDDAAWPRLDLPHDWAVEGGFDPADNVANGFRPKGVAWYRKRFFLPESDLGRSLYLEFDGVFRNATVWLNGHQLGVEPSGYTSFRFNISDVASFGGENVVAVRVDATDFEGWWYEGAGIYRHVWLVKAGPLHVAPWGVFAAAAFPDPENLTRAVLSVETAVVNRNVKGTQAHVVSTVVDAQGRTVATARTAKRFPAGERSVVAQTIALEQPRLWSLKDPQLYRLKTALMQGDAVVDEYETPFGVRSIRFDAQSGFHLNNQPVKIKGMCNHQDHAGVGVALPDRIHERRIEILKEMGCNAYRCAHNPPAPELLDACDRLGMLVMDETRLMAATPQGLHELESMILRDRNHPCIILWSMGNEEPIQKTDEGARIVRAMVRHAHRLDPTRPTTAASNGGWGSAFSHALDVEGINYFVKEYDPYHKRFPRHPIVSSENAATISTRGVYENAQAKGYVSAYDVNHADWAYTAETAWRAVADRPFIAGTFVWTGFDYRGEPQPMEWPCINSHFGVMDTCGFPKDNYFYYRAWWSGQPVLHILPHWNWPGKEGREIDVWCHGNSEEVELFLNGRSLGQKPMPRNGHLQWTVIYTAGTLSAKGYVGGKAVVAAERVTTGAPAGIRLVPDRSAVHADGEDVALIRVEVIDEAGRLVPTAGSMIEFWVSDNASIIGVGNGDPSCHESDKTPRRSAFCGLCQVIVQASRTPGDIVVRAESVGLKAAEIIITAAACAPRPRLESATPSAPVVTAGK